MVELFPGFMLASVLPSAVTMATHPSSPAENAGKLLLRVLLSTLLLFHGVAKVINGPDFIIGLVTQAGLPASLGYLVYVGEVLAPLLVLFGIWTRLAALVIAGNMMVAVFLVHRSELFSITKTGGWALELQAFFFGVPLAIVLLGAGRYSIGGPGGRWNRPDGNVPNELPAFRESRNEAGTSVDRTRPPALTRIEEFPWPTDTRQFENLAPARARETRPF